ncbi:MAG: hypothetical protein ACLUSP_06160 [Christensenellales bacterium]
MAFRGEQRGLRVRWYHPGFFNVVLSAAVERLSFYEEKGTDYYSLSAAKRKAYDGALSELIEYADKVKAGEEVAVPTTAGGLTSPRTTLRR